MKRRHPTLLTGATGGIGRATAIALASAGHDLAIVGRREDRLRELAQELEAEGARVALLPTDLADPEQVRALGERALSSEGLGALRTVVHCAGTSRFTVAEQELPEDVELQFQVNAIAPIQITESLLPHLVREQGTVVTVGSVFGAIGFAHFATYSATKFAMRGYAEALRRELEGTGVRVLHIAPRATRTAMTEGYTDMARAVGMSFDPPEKVAGAVLRSIERGSAERVVGFPESLFVRMNALLPRLIDRALRGQNRKARPFAEEASAPVRLPNPPTGCAPELGVVSATGVRS